MPWGQQLQPELLVNTPIFRNNAPTPCARTELLGKELRYAGRRERRPGNVMGTDHRGKRALGDYLGIHGFPFSPVVWQAHSPQDPHGCWRWEGADIPDLDPGEAAWRLLSAERRDETHWLLVTPCRCCAISHSSLEEGGRAAAHGPAQCFRLELCPARVSAHTTSHEASMIPQTPGTWPPDV